MWPIIDSYILLSILSLGLFRYVLTIELPAALNGQVIGLGKPDWLRQNTSVKLIFAS